MPGLIEAHAHSIFTDCELLPVSLNKSMCDRAVVLLLAALVVCGTTLADAVAAAIPRIALITTPGSQSDLEAGLRDGLRELGYAEGRNIIIERRSSVGTEEEMPALAAELMKLKVDLIVVSSTLPAKAALRLTAVPVVFAPVSDPVGTGLAKSLGRPGGNGTGISVPLTDLTAKRLEILRLAIPNARRIACLANLSNPAGRLQVDEARAAANVLGIQLIEWDAKSNADLEAILREIAPKTVDAVLITGDLLLMANSSKISRAMSKARLPAIVPTREFLGDGELLSYGPSGRDAARRAAAYVDKILRGAKASDLPIEELSEFELVVNLRVARALGVVVPEVVLIRANEVIH